jgi:hypothetical protein
MEIANEIMKNIKGSATRPEESTNMSISHLNNRWNSNIEGVIESRAINAN